MYLFCGFQDCKADMKGTLHAFRTLEEVLKTTGLILLFILLLSVRNQHQFSCLFWKEYIYYTSQMEPVVARPQVCWVRSRGVLHWISLASCFPWVLGDLHKCHNSKWWHFCLAPSFPATQPQGCAVPPEETLWMKGLDLQKLCMSDRLHLFSASTILSASFTGSVSGFSLSSLFFLV